MKFETLDINDDLKKAISDMGFERATPVQEQALPDSLEGKDIIAQSQTGTGKTAVFLITILNRMIEEGLQGSLTALILVPTRELAVQVEEQAKALCKYLPYKSVSIYGGVGYDQQEKQLKGGAEIAIATPGRLIDYIKSGTMDIKNVKFFVVDEADRMFDMGFTPDVKYILSKASAPDNRQTMLFSATLDFEVRRLAEQYMRSDPEEIEIEPDQITVDKVKQKLFHVSKEEKLPLLLTLIKKEEMPKLIIFTNMKRTAEKLVFKLNGNGFSAEVLTGDIDQKKRLRIIEQFKEEKIHILVATDVAARGLHVEGITHVINYDVPSNSPNYVHRIGRTARAGAEGIAYTIACEEWVEYLPDIEKYIEQKIDVEFIDFDLDDDQADTYRRHRVGKDGKPTSARRDDRSDRGGRSDRGDRRPSGRRGERGERGERSDRSDRRPAPRREKLPPAPSKTMSEDERLEYYKKKYNENFSWKS